MRISSQANEQYRKTSALAEKQSERASVQPHARTTVTSFGFRLGKFGLDYKGETTVLDPSLARDVRERKEKARAFRAEAEVEGLRAEVGATAPEFRENVRSGEPASTESASTESSPPQSRIKSALSAYAKAASAILPPPGIMLAGVV